MTKPLVALLLLLGLLAAACGGPKTPTPTAVPTPPSPEFLREGGYVYPELPRITAEELKVRLDEKSPIIVIDNRSVSKFNAGHLAGAFSITDAIGSPFPGAEEEMDRKLAELPNDVLKVLYCD